MYVTKSLSLSPVKIGPAQVFDWKIRTLVLICVMRIFAAMSKSGGGALLFKNASRRALALVPSLVCLSQRISLSPRPKLGLHKFVLENSNLGFRRHVQVRSWRPFFQKRFRRALALVPSSVCMLHSNLGSHMHNALVMYGTKNLSLSPAKIGLGHGAKSALCI